MPHLLVLRHGPLTGPDRLVAPLDARRAALPWVEHDLTADPTVPALTDDVAGLLVLGGVMDTRDDDPWLAPERELLAAAVAAGVPTLGICLGAQQLAVALGGTVSRLPTRNAALVPLTRTEDGRAHDVVAGWPDGAHQAFHNHDTVSELPAGARVLLAGSQVTTAAWCDATDTAIAVQFHPEASVGTVRTWEASREGGPDTDFLDRVEAAEPFTRAAGVSFVLRWLDQRVLPRA